MVDKFTKWYIKSYGTSNLKGRYTISNGHLKFDIHPLFDGNMRRGKYQDRIIVSIEQATQYAQFIINALNNAKIEDLSSE